MEIALVVFSILNPPKPFSTPFGTFQSIQDRYADAVLQQEPTSGGNLVHFPEEMFVERQSSDAASGGDATLPVDASTESNQRAAMDVRERSRALNRDQSEPSSASTEARRTGVLSSRSNEAADGRAVESEVSNQGILGAINSKQSNTQDQALQQVLSNDAETSGSGLKYSRAGGRAGSDGGANRGADGGRSTRDVRGERATTAGSIQEQVSGPEGNIVGSGLKRQTDMMQMDLTPLSFSDTESTQKDATKLGGRDPNKVASVVFGHSAAIQYCYERELQRNPDLKGKISVRFTILPDGSVANPSVTTSTLENRRVERCILARISRWDDFGEIDPSKDNATFRQVYTFGY